MARPQGVGTLAGLGLWLALALPARAEGLDLAPARACLERNAPKSSVSFLVEFVKTDRIGGERISRALVMGKKLDDGLRRIVLRFDRPLEIHGTAMLMIESANGPSDFYVWSPGERRVRRVSGRSNSGLFGTDFSYDDFENWRSFQKHGKAERQADGKIGERSVYVISSAPAAGEQSSYERIVSSVDQETCVVLHADPAKIVQVGPLQIATAIELEDKLDQTRTRVTLEDVKLDTAIPDARFRPADLSSGN